ncbi:MAG: hypothetical protein AAGC77_09215 [Pseudomonadota bacterium]
MSAASAIVAGEVAAAHERLRADASFQFHFSEAPAPSPQPDWLGWIMSVADTVLDFLTPLINIVFWLGILLIVFGAAYFIGREILLRIRLHEPDTRVGGTATYRPAPSFARSLLEEADRLAAAGRHSDAVRVLLFRSIEDIKLFQPNYLRKAMTSREIARLSILPASARAAFSEIASAVERSHFGGRVIGAEVFEKCRTAYGVFADVEDWS